ncbi:MAG: UvrD-helicase domain-containing protein [Phycisphaerales bacterium]|nr:UvrD-helicase domain-containing protein [Phycisphaerales bacterium]
MIGERTLITANAGCGKTWTLANRCIGWMLAHRRATGHAQPAGLVAATFTRKAAGEILHKLLRHLADAALDPTRIDEFAVGIDIDPPPSSDEFIEVLEDLVASLHRLQFGTLDGFFHRIAATFASEIGMPAGWTIGDDPTMSALQARALDDLLDACEQSTIDTLVLEAEREILKSRVHDQLLPIVFGKSGRGGLRSTWRQTLLTSSDAEPWRRLDDLPDDAIAPGARRQTVEAIEEACAALEMAAVPVASSTGQPRKRWVTARQKVLAMVGMHQWQSVLVNTIVTRISAGEEYDSAMAPVEFADALATIVAHARAELVAALRSRMRAWRLVLHGIDLAAARRQREAGVYSFQDIADHLARANLLSNANRDWLQFRLDAELRDLALDEFQDTSDAQFEVIRPIISEILAGEGGHELPRSMLVVADPKQSIYGWRGGTPSLLQVLRDMGEGELQQGTLDRSYRSGPAIIDFVNDVFGSLETNSSLDGVSLPTIPAGTLSRCGLPEIDTSTTPVKRALRNWQFDHHETAFPDTPSAIMAWRIDPDDEDDEDGTPMTRRVVDIVRKRSAVSGSIGILLPTNALVSEVVTALRAAGLDASEEGSGALTESCAVHDLLALLRLADHPGNRDAAYDVSHSPLGPMVGLPPLETIPPADRSDILSRVSRSLRRRAIDEGLEGLLVSLCQEMEPHSDAKDRQALRHCVDLAAAWRPGGVLRLSDFVHHVEASSAGEPSGAAVRVMTMHTAKGLEFDEVILPTLDELMVKQGHGGACTALSLAQGEPAQIVLPQLAEPLRQHAPVLEVAAQRQWELNLGDRLSLLYVIVTRARRVLNLVLQADEKLPGEKLTSANVIRAALPDLDEALRTGREDKQGRIWMQSAAGWSDETVVPYFVEEPTSGMRPIQVAETEDTGSVTPSASTTEALSDRFRAWNTRARRRGTLLHELFGAIDWLEDGRPDDAAIEAAIARATIGARRPPTSAEQEEAIEVFQAALDDEAIAHRLSRKAYAEHGADTLEVLQEWPILERIDGRLVRGRIDRMVVGRRGGEIVFIDIVDFKSGRIEDDQAEVDAIEYYRPQVEFYVESALVHFELDPATVTGRLLFIEAGRDLPCTPCPTAPSSS